MRDEVLKSKATLTGHSKEVRCLATYDDVIVCGSSEHDVRVWDAVTARCLQVLRGHNGPVQLMKFCGSRIVSSSADGQARIWDPANGYVLHCFEE